MEIRDGERLVLLNDGQRLETSLDKPGLKVSEFVEYGTRIGSSSSSSQEELSIKTRSTLDLLQDAQPAYRAELGWRLGLAMAAFNFVVLGLAIAVVNPRAGRSGSLAFALFSFVMYYNLMTVGQSWVAAGRLGVTTYMLALHGGTLVLGLALLAARHNNWSLRSLWARRKSA